jgi:hypothetical protein
LDPFRDRAWLHNADVGVLPDMRQSLEGDHR